MKANEKIKSYVLESFAAKRQIYSPHSRLIELCVKCYNVLFASKEEPQLTHIRLLKCRQGQLKLQLKKFYNNGLRLFRLFVLEMGCLTGNQVQVLLKLFSSSLTTLSQNKLECSSLVSNSAEQRVVPCLC
jgi:hypothetical protein